MRIVVTGADGFIGRNLRVHLREAGHTDVRSVTRATPADELKSVLTGGTVNNVAYDGILNLRASGMGWGVIAQELGFKLGEVKRADKPVVQPIVQPVEKAERVAKVERVAKPERPERPVKPERPEKPERPGKGR